MDLEIVVINDSKDDEETKKICSDFGAKYILSGRKDTDSSWWRGPGKALNIGIKKAKGDVIIISGSEMFLLDNTCIFNIVQPVFENEKNLGVSSNSKDDIKGDFLNCIESSDTKNLDNIFESCIKLSNEIPFFMAISKTSLFNIRGYDEDFSNYAGYDDNDIAFRLIATGHKYVETECRVVHLYHHRFYDLKNDTDELDFKKVMERNLNLFNDKKKESPIRNPNGWGELNG